MRLHFSSNRARAGARAVLLPLVLVLLALPFAHSHDGCGALLAWRPSGAPTRFATPDAGAVSEHPDCAACHLEDVLAGASLPPSPTFFLPGTSHPAAVPAVCPGFTHPLSAFFGRGPPPAFVG